MLQLKLFNLSIAGVAWRLYQMMAIGVVFGHLNLWYTFGTLKKVQ